ncbi:GNAT family N-acetyltransferase, partial [Micromonospora sp. SL4-19]|uniref:GNAT family N-acetyltransferase n=1 Tax=Micromonospora sp. SL4-19 TaxID=3399129 RepID=UPI003A4D8DC0
TFPETRLRTGDLLLRPFSAIDIEANQIACADPLIQQWLPLPQPYTRHDSADWCTKISHSLRETGDGIHFAIVDANTDHLLGTVGLKKTDWRGLVSEIGYSVVPWARRRGIAAEATRTIGHWLLVDHGFQRMELKAATGNLASQRTALKAGLQREGIMRNAGFIHAARVDLVLFSLTPDDLKSQSDQDQRGANTADQK